MRTRVVIVGPAIVVSAAGIAVCHAQYATAATDPGPAAPAPVPIVAEKVQVSDVPIVLTGIGTLTGYNVVHVHARVTGTIDSIGLTEGQIVHPGSLIARLDPRPFQKANFPNLHRTL
jgi:membrane fusion protein, multidrug efflux system